MSAVYYNFLLAISLLTVYTAGVYRLYQLNYAGVFSALIMAAITFIILKKWEKGKWNSEFRIQNSEFKRQPSTVLLVTFYFLLLTSNFFILFQSSTSISIISPWQVIPWYFWITFTVSTFLLIAIILKNSLPHFYYFLLLTSYFLLSTNIAVVIYTVGFGFDPFIHQATEKLIALSGAVYPKPLYYLGQYGLIVSLHKLFFLPLVWLDKLLVPVLAALTLPYALYQAAKAFTADERVAKLSALFILIFPFATFTLTTPQNLANLFVVILILISLTAYDLRLLAILALAALAIHPIAGIPAVLFAAFLVARQYVKNKNLLLTSYFLLLTLSVVSLPLAFAFTNNSLAATPTDTQPMFQLPKLFFSDVGNFLLNFIYLYGFNIGLIIALFVAAGILIYYRNKKILNTQYQILNTFLVMSAALLVSFFITKFVNFSYLISYERSNFADRILAIAVYFSLPFILLALVKLIEAILQQERAVKYLLFCFFVFLLTCSLYFSYPRYDDYYNSRSFSTAQADIDAVRWIEQNATDDNFIVLANQQVSAAALKEFGFKKYYRVPPPYQGGGEGEVFYYPIPTGEKLYQYYLDMVNKQANKKTALKAADLVGADTVYFVLNNYWFGFEKVLAEARLGADAVQSIDGGKVFVFKYKK
jgi:hypothetical protein